MSNSSRLFLTSLAAAALVACEQPTEPSLADFDVPLPSFAIVENEVVPVALGVFIPCALDGLGEVVVLEGTLHFVTGITEDANGGLHVTTSAQPQRLQGVGLTSGDRYNGTGITREQFNTSGLPFETTYVNNYRVIGQRDGNNYLVHTNTHLTINANGEVTTEIDNSSVECM